MPLHVLGPSQLFGRSVEVKANDILMKSFIRLANSLKLTAANRSQCSVCMLLHVLRVSVKKKANNHSDKCERFAGVFLLTSLFPNFKECMFDSVTNYNYVGDTKISVSIKKTNANKCTLSEIFLTEILK